MQQNYKFVFYFLIKIYLKLNAINMYIQIWKCKNQNQFTYIFGTTLLLFSSHFYSL